MHQKQKPDKLIKLLFQTGQLIREQARSSEKLNPASFVQLHILQFIAMTDSKEPVNMSDIAHFLNITPPSATSLVNNLVKNGQLRRVADTSDRRMICLELTSHGLKALAWGRARLIKQMRKVLGVLNRQEQNQIIAILQKISKQYKI